MSVGECTITLHYVKVLVELPIDGESITNQSHDEWLHLCQVLLGVTPHHEQIMGSRLSLTWLGTDFPGLADDVDEKTITRYAWVYIL